MVENVKRQLQQPEIHWIDEQATPEDISILQQEASEESAFDRLELRKRMWVDLLQGRAELLCRTCSFGKVLVVYKKGEPLDISWDLWARILQGFAVKARICWFASDTIRQLPAKGPVLPEHVNGGYTFPCETGAVVIYRKEEATRVLIHELLHASCTDNPRASVEAKEAATETYAELLLVAYASRGSKRLAAKLWALQAQWIADQNQQLREQYGVTNIRDYAARYTLAREFELQRLGITLPPPTNSKTYSSRFTTAELDKYLF
jgi:hypothetical protein